MRHLVALLAAAAVAAALLVAVGLTVAPADAIRPVRGGAPATDLCRNVPGLQAQTRYGSPRYLQVGRSHRCKVWNGHRWVMPRQLGVRRGNAR